MTADAPLSADQMIERAFQMVSSLCLGRKRWVMSIPPQPDEDPDFVIGDGLIAGRDALKALAASEARVKKLEEALKETVDTLADMHEGDECRDSGGTGCLACLAQEYLNESLAPEVKP